MRALLCFALAILAANLSAYAQAVPTTVVPRAVGLSYEKAKARFEASELVYDFDPEPPPGPTENYRVVKLSPEAGSIVSEGVQVTAKLQLVEPGQLVAPELLQMSLPFALGELYLCDFTDDRIKITPSDHAPDTMVSEVKETPGAIIDLNNAINVVVLSKKRHSPNFLFDDLALVGVALVAGLVLGWFLASRFRGRASPRG